MHNIIDILFNCVDRKKNGALNARTGEKRNSQTSIRNLLLPRMIDEFCA